LKLLLAGRELAGCSVIALAFPADDAGSDQTFPERVIIAARRAFAGEAETPGRFLLAREQREYQRDRGKCSPNTHGSFLLTRSHVRFHGLLLDPNPGRLHDKNNSRLTHGAAGQGHGAMEKFTVLEGVAAPLKVVNVDTDMIIPKQYLKTIKRTGLGKGLFSEKRYKDDGSENPDFILNKPAYRNAKVLVAGDNFGCGSSREHAPWALLDFGIRCVISTSFGDIFYNNSFKNGILPIRVTQEELDKLFDDAERGANATLTIDLEKQEIRGPDGGCIKFEIDAHRKHCLLNGLDDIGLTMVKKDKIDSFESKVGAERPWH
jgi:3-isopropylmalate/(R)-2-methylmalate dehydratase small subunit